MVASRKHPGIFWVHNDSGNPPSLFAVRRDGSLVRSYRVEAANVDWRTSPSTTRGTSTSVISATTATACRSGRSTDSTSPTPPRPRTASP